MNLWRIAVLLAVCIAASALAPTSVFAVDNSPMPRLDIGRGGKCVDDPKFMRKNHMDLLKHQRDETVQQGIRGGKYSLAVCVDCHASKKNNSVLGSNENFCQGCHAYVKVKIDCFECHASKRKVVAEVIQ